MILPRLPLLLACIGALTAPGAEAARVVRIPPAYLPGAGTEPSRADIIITLVDVAGVPVPASSQPNAALFVGAKRLTVTTEPVALTVATQDQINGETWYQISVQQGTQTWTRRVQVPQADGADLTWAEFTGLSAPVQPQSWQRVPDPTLLPDGRWLKTNGGLWVTTDEPAGGGLPTVPEDAVAGWGLALDNDLAPVWSASGGGVTEEADPLYSASVAAGITSDLVAQWNSAWGWGNHALAGYLTAEADTAALAAIAGLDAADVGADVAGAASAAMTAHTGASDPHPIYTTAAAAAAAAPVQSVAGRTGAVTLSASDLSGLAKVATSGAYGDLTGRPSLAPVATTGAYGDLTGRPDLSGYALTSALGTAAFVAIGSFDAAGAAAAVAGDLAGHQSASNPHGITPTGIGAATAAQGLLAGSAMQPGDDAADLGSGAASVNQVLTADGAGGAQWATGSGGGGVTDHGLLTGLADDDHPQYATSAEAAAAAPVQSVAGRTGAVALTFADLTGTARLATPGLVTTDGVTSQTIVAAASTWYTLSSAWSVQTSAPGCCLTWDAGTGLWTATVPVDVLFSGCVRAEIGSATGMRIGAVVSGVARLLTGGITANPQRLCGAGSVRMATGDTLGMGVWLSSARTISVTPDPESLWMAAQPAALSQ